ncbi:MAG TPA: class I SAM-dependent methyltransferase [Gemmatimonadaceae bacterium]
MTGPMIFTPEYYARMRALESDGWWNAAMRDVAARLLGLSAIGATGTMLDVGCGSGQTMGWFRSLYPEWEAAGVDVSPEAVAAARQTGAAVSIASALALPFADGSVDLVLTLDVFQHLPLRGGDLAALAEIQRVLRPGGLLLLRTNAQATPRVADDAAASFHKYEPAELDAKLRATGFEILRLSRINGLLGLAEIPRELRAARHRRAGAYSGILADTRREPRWSRELKEGWLRLEGRAVAAGARLPMGRTIVALCRSGVQCAPSSL